MPNRRRLSTLYYDFIPTSFISPSVPINCIIKQVISNAVTGKYGDYHNNDYSADLITLSPFVQYTEEKDAVQYIDEFYKKQSKIMLKYERDQFCIKRNLEIYSIKKATCFLVLGKPTSKIYRVAKYLAQKTKRHHIDIIRLVAREIIKNTPLGNWLWANLAWGKKIPDSIAMMLLHDELEKKIYKQHGYVLSGLPIIPSCDLKQNLLPFALGKFPCVPPPYVRKVHNRNKKKDKKKESDASTEEEETYGEFEEKEEIDNVSRVKNNNVKYDSTSEEVSEEEWETSSSEDESDYPGQAERRLNFSKQGTYKLPLSEEAFTFSIEHQLSLLLDLDMSPDIIVYLNIEDNEDITATKENLLDEDKSNLLIQLGRYEKAFSCIQNFLLHYRKETVIKIDGRLGLVDLFEQLDNRLEYLNYKKLYDAEWLFPVGIPEDLRNSFQAKTFEDCLQILCETKCIQTNFNWLKSDFQTYCPIENYRGKRVQGNLDFSIRYLGYIYLLSSYENMKTFISEPEKYFLPRPNCRIAIIGPTRTGKTTLAKHLKLLLEGQIYNVTQAICKLYDENCENKYAQAFQWAQSQAKDLCKTRYDYYLNLRTAKLEEWKENVLSQLKEALDTINLNTYAFSLNEIEKILQDSKYFNEILPEICKTDEDLKDLECSQSVFSFFLHEKLLELYTECLLENEQLAFDFITFVQTGDENLKINTNHDKRHGQWIIDGAPVDLRFWKKLEENNCLPDVVIFLSNCSEEKLDEIYGRGLNRKFTSWRYVFTNIIKTNCHYFTKAKIEDKDFLKTIKKSTPINECISKYSKFLAPIKLAENIHGCVEVEKLEEYLKSKDIPLLTSSLSNSTWSEVILDALIKNLNLFKSNPRRLSPDDLRKLNGSQSQPNFKDIAEHEEEEVEEEDKFVENLKISEKNILKDIRLGSLKLYCPVLFTDHQVLNKGRLDLSIEYENLNYFFSSEQCLSKFIQNPEKYAKVHNKPLVPAMRIWIIRPNYTEKTQFSLLLKDEFRTKSISFHQGNFVLTNNKVVEEMTLANLDYMDNFNLSEEMVNNLKYFLEKGAILTGFPCSKQQFMDMISYALYPEAILIMDDYKSLLEEVYKNELKIRITIKNTPKKNAEKRLITVEEDENTENEFTHFSEEMSEIDSSVEFKPKGLTIAEKRDIYEICHKTVKASETNKQEIESLAESLNIPVFKIPKNIKNPEFLKRIGNFLHNHHVRFSLFDQILDIPMNTAMLALDKGLFRYSRFGKSCPVDVENIIALNHYTGSLKRERIFPCLYREYIYFINGKDNLRKFKDNPFKYVNTCHPYQYSVPLRIAVLGPTSSGCTTLCKRIAKEFAMEIFTKKDFEILLKRKFHWTQVYRKFVDNKNVITDDILPHCLMLNENVTPNGIILDDFPLDASYILKAARYNVDFHIILVLNPSFEDLWSNWRTIASNIKIHSIKQLHTMFTAYSEFIARAEMTNESGLQLFNIFSINSMPCKWACWCAAKSKIIQTTRGIVGFEFNVANRRCASLLYLNIFEYELSARFAPIGPYCPICAIEGKLIRYRYDYLDVGKKFYEKKCQEELLRPFGYNSKSFYEAYKFPHPWSRNSDYPPLLSKFAFRTNLFVYQDHFYWSCDDHLVELLLNTPAYLPLMCTYLPPYVPLLVLTYLKLFLEHEGFCIVTYAKNLPNKVYVKGDTEYAIYYKGKIFLVTSQKAALEFLREPQKYYRIKLKLENPEDIDWDFEGMKLDLGTLTRSLVTKTIVETANTRPKHFAMNTMESVAVLMALHLKIQNNLQSPLKRIIFQSALTAFLNECNIIQNRLNTFKQYKNPFIVHESQDEVSTRRVPVPDERYDYLCEYFKPLSKVPAFLNVVDIAGLVKGAAEGQGLGNAFLSHISACDAIFHLCRAFDDTEVIHVEGEVDPVRDLDIISEELRLKDEEKLMQNLEKLERTVCRGGDKKLKPEYDALVKIKGVVVDEKKHIRFAEWNTHDIEVLNKYLFLTSKPVIYLVNLTEKDFIRKKNKWLIKIKEWIDKNDPGASIIPFSAAFEQKISEMEEAERKAYEDETKCKSVLDKIIVTGYKALQLEYFFTAGADEVKAWTIQKGTKAPQAAGKIHTDFEKGFIMAEVMHYKDFKEEGSETAVKAAGKYRQQGRNYSVEDGDIIFFKFNAGAGLKDAKKK